MAPSKSTDKSTTMRNLQEEIKHLSFATICTDIQPFPGHILCPLTQK